MWLFQGMGFLQSMLGPLTRVGWRSPCMWDTPWLNLLILKSWVKSRRMWGGWGAKLSPGLHQSRSIWMLPMIGSCPSLSQVIVSEFGQQNLIELKVANASNLNLWYLQQVCNSGNNCLYISAYKMEVPPPAKFLMLALLCQLRVSGGFYLGRRSPGGDGGVMDTNPNKI